MDLSHVFWNEGLIYANHHLNNSRLTGNRKFRTFYGISPELCSILWNRITDKPAGCEPKHLLWCMLFLKNYHREHVNAAIVSVDEKTFRKWTWLFVELLSELNAVKWENRLKNSKNTRMHVSLDGTDFPIREPEPFDPKWFSHTFKGAGLRYEVGLSIFGGDIVWASGGFPCGEWNDIKIATDLYVEVAGKEITLADKGYKMPGVFKQPSNAFEKRVMARHETVNAKLKHFDILKQHFRNAIRKHPMVFHAVVNVVQIAIENGEELFEV